MEQWTSTLDKRVAAALSALGVIVKLNTTFRERTGVEKTRFHLSLVSTDKRIRTRILLEDFKRGKLEAREPAHPFLTILRAYENARRILECAEKGTRIRLQQIGETGVWQYVDGTEGLPGNAGNVAVLRTGDLKCVAALATVGLPVLWIEGSKDKFTFYVSRFGPPRAGLPPVDGYALRAAWCDNPKAMPWSDPFVQAAHGLRAREMMDFEVENDPALILVEKPRSTRSALMHPDASNGAWDLMKLRFDK